MKYSHIVPAVFLCRPNRFIAEILVNGQKEICHVKNTGRCKELLKPETEIYVQYFPQGNRKTKYDLITVVKNGRLINIDSQAPNAVVKENARLLFPDYPLIRPETVYGNSRFDFFGQAEHGKMFAEVKGVTLENNGEARFPDAPTERGAKHVMELLSVHEAGMEAQILFLLQMDGMRSFRPNDETDPVFGLALRRAAAGGVKIRAYQCSVTPNSLTLKDEVPIEL